MESREYNTYASKFENLWKTYPKRQGRKEALRHFIATVKTDVEYDSCAAALRNYVAYIKKNNIEERFIKHGSTFFNNWSEWVTPPTAQIQSEVAAWMK